MQHCGQAHQSSAVVTSDDPRGIDPRIVPRALGIITWTHTYELEAVDVPDLVQWRCTASHSVECRHKLLLGDLTENMAVSQRHCRGAFRAATSSTRSDPGLCRHIHRSLGDLYDDLAEVRGDVLAVLDNVDSAVESDLTWQARFDFETHWSWHALDALRALHPSR